MKMNQTLEEILHWLDGRMATPTTFGWFHIMWLVIMVAACTLVYVFRKRFTQRAVSNILLITGIIVIIFEVYKQVVFSSFHYVGGGASYFEYSWYTFPFQFCSTPMLVMLLAGIFRKGLFNDAMKSYLATFALFGGLCVMAYPGDVFVPTIGINIQTMVCHASMVVVGFMLWATKSVEFNFKTLLKAVCVFVVFVALALGMNVLWHFYGDPAQTFNMFYISPYTPCTLPLLSMIYPKVPYFLFLIIYIIGFALAAMVMLLFAMLGHKIQSKVDAKKGN